MRGLPNAFWGKLYRDREDAAVVEWHPLPDHCADVAAVTEALLRLPIWRERLTRLAARAISDVSWPRLCVLAALHDIGKFNLGFQAKGRPELGPTAGHVREALGALFRSPGVFACLDELAAWGDSVTALLVSALCHHGRPYNDTSQWQATWWSPRADLNPQLGIDDLFSRCRSWYPTAFQPEGSSLPETPAFSHAFAGLVMLADWIGSDTRFFPFSEAEDSDRMEFARTKAAAAVAAMGLDVSLADRRDPRDRDPFARVAPEGYLPRPAQTALVTLPHEQSGSITILEAETGSGKTEAVLARFVSLFEAGLVDGLYFALPMRSAATQMHRRVHEATQQAFVSPPPVVLAVPGYLRVDDAEGTRLAPFDVLWADEERFRYRAWAAENSKRYLSACIAVGTIDQVLLSSLRVGHAHLRATALLRQLLVVDEVHASDAYMTTILEDVLARHLAAGGHAILLSATLGSEARARLLRPSGDSAPPAFMEAEAVPYPLVSHAAAVERRIGVPSPPLTRGVELDVRPWLNDYESVAREALAAGLRGAKVLVIRNTVSDCVKTQVALERLATAGRDAETVLFTCAGLLAPHHALFARDDRHALDLALEEQVGKHPREGGCVVVATQTVQQSLDLDVDLLFSDLCPADVLLQRLGRLHRHVRLRPEGFDRARAFIIVPTLRDLGVLIGPGGVPRNHHGLGRVYPDLRILEATWRLIEAHTEWRIPAMNRHLVESSVHSSILSGIVEEGGHRWQDHARYVISTERGHERHAALNLVDWSRSYAELSFASSPDDARIVTRLGEGDRRVRFSPPSRGPFGCEFSELVLRPWWTRGVSATVEDAEIVASSKGVTRFRFGESLFVYDRLGLRSEQHTPEEVAHDDGP